LEYAWAIKDVTKCTMAKNKEVLKMSEKVISEYEVDTASAIKALSSAKAYLSLFVDYFDKSDLAVSDKYLRDLLDESKKALEIKVRDKVL